MTGNEFGYLRRIKITQKLEDLLGLPQTTVKTSDPDKRKGTKGGRPKKEEYEDADPLVGPDQAITPSVINLQERLESFDKISSALPKVEGLGSMSDSELDVLANKAEVAFDDLMTLGMNVEPRFSSRMFEVAGAMLKTAVDAKSAKIDKKLKMVELQLKKLAIDKKSQPDAEAEESTGYVITDRNSLIAKLKNSTK